MKPGQYSARIHIHRIVIPHQKLYLSKRQPPEVLANRNIILNTYDDISVPFPEEASALFTLELIKNYLLRLGVFEIVKISWTLPSVNTRVVAPGRLQRRRKLNTVHIAGLNLGLEKEIQYSIELLADNSKVANFGLIDNWLFPLKNPILILVDVDADNRKELSRLVTEIPGFLVKVPPFHFRERDLSDIHLNFTIPPFNPRQDLLRGIERIIRCQQ
jgi:hypothetical protein